MNHGKHSYVMIAIVAVGAVLFLTGNAGGLLFLVWPLACMAMMFWMMWGMRGMGRSVPVRRITPVPHDDGRTHAHEQRTLAQLADVYELPDVCGPSGIMVMLAEKLDRR